jgi:hypothetical protein
MANCGSPSYLDAYFISKSAFLIYLSPAWREQTDRFPFSSDSDWTTHLDLSGLSFEAARKIITS